MVDTAYACVTLEPDWFRLHLNKAAPAFTYHWLFISTLSHRQYMGQELLNTITIDHVDQGRT